MLAAAGAGATSGQAIGEQQKSVGAVFCDQGQQGRACVRPRASLAEKRDSESILLGRGLCGVDAVGRQRERGGDR